MLVVSAQSVAAASCAESGHVLSLWWSVRYRGCVTSGTWDSEAAVFLPSFDIANLVPAAFTSRTKDICLSDSLHVCHWRQYFRVVLQLNLDALHLPIYRLRPQVPLNDSEQVATRPALHSPSWSGTIVGPART